MLHYDELDAAGRAAFDETVAGSHRREVELVAIRRRDSQPIGSLTNQFMGGIIQGDVDRAPVTWVECDVFDDERILDWSNGEHWLYRIQIIDRRFVAALNDWVEAEVHTGPVEEFKRVGPVVSLTIEGPEMDLMGSVRSPETWPGKTLATRVLRQVLALAGARPQDMSIPPSKRRLPRDVTIGVRRGKDDAEGKDRKKGPKRQVLKATREETYHDVIDPIPEAIGRELFTDGRGRFLLRPPTKRASLQLTRSVLTEPVVETPPDDGEETNTWYMRGANPKGPRSRVAVKVELPDTHPASAWARRWNGVRREVSETIENKHFRTDKAAREAGQRRRDRALRAKTQYQVSTLLVALWIRPNSQIGLPTGAGRAVTRVRRWTMPLGPGPDPISIGVNRRRGWAGKR